MHLTLKTITAELHRLDPDVQLKRGDGYYYFSGGVADTWLDRTVKLRRLDAFTLEQWVAEFTKLKKLNEEMSRGKKSIADPRKK